MRNFFALLLRSLFWGVVLGLTLALLEVSGILAYLQWTGKLEGKYLTHISTPFAFFSAMGAGLGLACGLFWVLLSRTSWHRRLEPAQVRAWQRGLLVGNIHLACC